MFYRPPNIAEALRLKAELGREGVFLAGGTDLVAQLAKGQRQIEHWIDLSGIPELCFLKDQGDGLCIGPTTTCDMLIRCPAQGLAAAASLVGGPSIRNRGTIAGNLATASPAGDVCVALLALESRITLTSVAGSRQVDICQFFTGPGRTVLEPEEMITSVFVPLPYRSGFLKLGKRNAMAISVVSAAAAITRQGVVSVALGSVAPTPRRARRAEDFLAMRGLSVETAKAASDMVDLDISPIDDLRASARYRKAMAQVLTKRLLEQLAGSPASGRTLPA